MISRPPSPVLWGHQQLRAPNGDDQTGTEFHPKNSKNKNKTKQKARGNLNSVLSNSILGVWVPPTQPVTSAWMEGTCVYPEVWVSRKRALLRPHLKLSFPILLELVQVVLNPKLSKADVPGHPALVTW